MDEKSLPIEAQIPWMLHSLGLWANLRGYHYLRVLLPIYLTEHISPAKLWSIGSALFQKSKPQILSSVRNAIHSAWKRDPVEYAKVNGRWLNRAPTVNEFLLLSQLWFGKNEIVEVSDKGVCSRYEVRERLLPEPTFPPLADLLRGLEGCASDGGDELCDNEGRESSYIQSQHGDR